MNRIFFDGAWWSEVRGISARIARRGASDAADDLAQDLAVRALENGGAADRPGAWLERVARNHVIDEWRVQHRRDELTAQLAPPCRQGDPEAQLLTRERRRTLRRALLTLPRDQRQATLLRYQGDLPFAAVAARLDTLPATARTRVNRALARLRGLVQGLRVMFVGWHGAQATALGLALAGAVGSASSVPDAAPLAATPTPVASSRAPGRHRSAIAAAVRVLARVASPAATADAAPTPAARHAARPHPSANAEPEPAPLKLRFEDDDPVDGVVVGPDGDQLFVATRAAQPSLIEIRRELIPEILKSLEEL
jgi:RNA polymerase sigma-70 factor (ECF subfamily)